MAFPFAKSFQVFINKPFRIAKRRAFTTRSLRGAQTDRSIANALSHGKCATSKLVICI